MPKFRPRRPFRPARPMRRLIRRAALAITGPLMIELQRANALEAQGKPADAALIFARLSDLAIQRAMPVRAGNLSFRAARSFIEIQDVNHALKYARQGLKQLGDTGQWERVQQIGSRILAGLRERGFAKEADAFEKELIEHLRNSGYEYDLNASVAETAERRGSVPPKCPQCAGPLRSDEAEWIDQDTVECPFCGSAVKTV